MAKPGGKFVGYQDLTREEIRDLKINSFLEDYQLALLPGGRIFFTLERLQEQHQLSSIKYLMSYAYVRRPMRMICKMYRKVKRSNCIVRCYLKTTEVVLQEIKETCPYINEIDELIYLGMQFPTIINFYKLLFQGILAYHCNAIKITVLRSLISLLVG